FGILQNPRVEITHEIICSCIDDDCQGVKNVLSCITRLLQAQTDVLKNDNDQDEERDNKRYKKK
ncbi:12215_t:CDS:1, partial [Dentiscutata erythropus]